jgi:hypothetical protein
MGSTMGSSEELPDESGSSQPVICTFEEMEVFSNCKSNERKVTDSLKGVMAETALTGRVRYKWTVLRPLVEHMLETVLMEYDASSSADVGPSRFTSYGESVPQTIDRLKGYLSGFSDAPWTLQRLCELLLAPQKQYRSCHKLAMAIERCLLVTSELPVTKDLPLPPRLNDLGPVNENPTKRLCAGTDGGVEGVPGAMPHRSEEYEVLGSGLAGAALAVKAHPDVLFMPSVLSGGEESGAQPMAIEFELGAAIELEAEDAIDYEAETAIEFEADAPEQCTPTTLFDDPAAMLEAPSAAPAVSGGSEDRDESAAPLGSSSAEFVEGTGVQALDARPGTNDKTAEGIQLHPQRTPAIAEPESESQSMQIS